jgi:hypothetical protein
MNVIKSNTLKLKAKRTFIKKGTCSNAFFYILNREFGHPRKEEEAAVDLLAGGILQQGYQCGLVWGASMAIGAEAYRRTDSLEEALGLSITATQSLMDSFMTRTGSIECEDITACDFTNRASFAKYMLSGKFVSCYILAGKWAPEALDSAIKGLSVDQNSLPPKAVSCASELIRQMGGTEEEMAMVSGFAGGLGLSGSGCGALAAALWMNSLLRNRQQSDNKTDFKNPESEKILNTFYEKTDYKMECKKICGRKFETLEAHTEFVKNGECKKLILALSEISKV